MGPGHEVCIAFAVDYDAAGELGTVSVHSLVVGC